MVRAIPRVCAGPEEQRKGAGCVQREEKGPPPYTRMRMGLQVEERQRQPVQHRRFLSTAGSDMNTEERVQAKL